MKCPNCSKVVKKDDMFCRSCGEALQEESKKKEKKKSTGVNQDEIFNKIGDNLEKILDTEDTSKDYTKKDVNDNKGLAFISYFGPLALIPYFYNKGSKYVKYHAIQGMNLLVLWIGYFIFANILYLVKVTKTCTDYFPGLFTSCTKVTPWWIKLPVDIIGLTLFAISIIGAFYALTGVAKKLPLVDKVNVFKQDSKDENN